MLRDYAEPNKFERLSTLLGGLLDLFSLKYSNLSPVSSSMSILDYFDTFRRWEKEDIMDVYAKAVDNRQGIIIVTFFPDTNKSRVCFFPWISYPYSYPVRFLYNNSYKL